MQYSALLVMVPVFLPLMKSIGIHPLHFGAFCVLNLVIGLVSPPVGMYLFVSANIGKLSIERVSAALIPFLVAVILVLILLTYWPQVVMWIPKMLGYVESFFRQFGEIQPAKILKNQKGLPRKYPGIILCNLVV